MTIPFLEVAHLPSSCSFYSAILQPLGLQYLSHPGSDSSSSTSASARPYITYGTPLPPTPVFQLRQVNNPNASRIVLTAQSPVAVTDFHRFSLRANPDLVPAAGLGASGGGTAPETEESRARIIDYDGNTMEVVYRPPHQSRHGEPSVRTTQSTTAEVNRILNWNYGAVASNPPTVIGSRAEASHFGHDDAPYKGLRRAMTSSTYETASPREASNGFNTSTVMGTLLGVAAGAAAGAAITYSMVKNEHSRASKHEFEAPAFTRRSTFPAAHFSADQSVPRYVEVERTVEKVHPNEYPPVDARRPPPEYIARYSEAGGSRAGRSQKASSRVAEDVYDDTRSRHSSRHGASSVRTRSVNPENRRQLMITETEHRSYVGSSSSSRHGNSPPITRGVQRSHTFDVSDRDSYVSSGSQRSQSTIRPPPAPSAAASQYLAKSRAGSRVTTTTVKMPAQAPASSQTPRAMSRAGSYMSARNVPLPRSVAGTAYSSHPWNVPLPPSNVGSSWDDDSGSVAPDDSISCVGSRRSYYA